MSALRSSQISIYNYPEHLNPFYEDDQHKRIRFWKINRKDLKDEKKEPFSGRRGSFNLGSLKDLLPLRSFRLKKKSSTLGVNKTSESPPVIRREAFSENLSAYDPKNRVSLENIFANRNSRYRSTIGPTATSFTPTPRSRYTFNNGMTPGSSMNSVASTNPFELETDDEATRISRSTLTVTGGDHKRYRKKRRAPLPPERKNDAVTENVVLRIDEPSGSRDDGLEELSRLTAEFESFVKDSINDDDINNNVSSHVFDRRLNIKEQEQHDDHITEIETNVEISSEKTPEVVCNGLTSKGNSANVIERETLEIIERKSAELEKSALVADEKFGEEVPIVEEPADEIVTNGTLEVVDKIQEVNEEEPKLPGQVVHADEENYEVTERRSVVEVKIQNREEKSRQKIINDEIVTEVSTPVTQLQFETNDHRDVTPDFIPVPVREKFHVLKIEEDDSPSASNNGYRETISQSQVVVEEPPKSPAIPHENILHIREEKFVTAGSEISQKLSSQGFVRVEQPIEFYEPIETFIRRTSVSEAEEPPKPPERRRSVKDIIESINRNQKLLRINQVAPEQEEKSERYSYREKPALPSKHNVNLKLQRQAENERSINRLLDDLNDFDKGNSSNETPQPFPSVGDKPDVIIFETCNVKTNHERSSSAVNPIAKPRRVPESSKEWL